MEKMMKILIVTDMEGCAGVLNHDDWVMPAGRYYEKGQRILTEETNAAIAGFFDAGASEVLVVDGHGMGGIDPELLDERAMVQRGRHPGGFLGELDEGYAGMAFVGQHAKAGTPFSHITHTQWFNYIDLAINGVSIGEYGQCVLLGMERGVRTFFAAGELALTHEAAELTPGVVTVAVKRGLLPDGLDHLDAEQYRAAKLGAVHCAPKQARKLIYEGARKAAQRLKSDPTSFQFPQIKPPYIRTARFRRDGDKPAWQALDRHESSLTEIIQMPYTPVR